MPYAERASNRVFTGSFASYVPILERAWQPYLDGRVTLGAAVDAVVASRNRAPRSLGCPEIGDAALTEQ